MLPVRLGAEVMDKLKNTLVDIYGEDWSGRLEDIAAGREKAKFYGKR